MPSVTQSSLLPNSNSSTSSVPSSPIRPGGFQPPNLSSISNQTGGVYSPQRLENPVNNYNYSSNTPSKSSDQYSPSGRDANLQKRINELTLERSDLSAKLFKQEKAYEELFSQNNLLRQRISSLEKSAGSSQLLQDRINLLESQNKKQEEEIAQLKENHEREKNQWHQERQNMAQSSSTMDALVHEKDKLENKLKENMRTFQEVRIKFFFKNEFFVHFNFLMLFKKYL